MREEECTIQVGMESAFHGSACPVIPASPARAVKAESATRTVRAKLSSLLKRRSFSLAGERVARKPNIMSRFVSVKNDSAIP